MDRYLSEADTLPKAKFGERSDQRLFKEVIIHLDFKGAPPKFGFLKDLIRFIATKFDKVVTGILFEFEDTFPYEGNLKPLMGSTVYTKEQIRELIELMNYHNLTMIPLIQTFGHLEFALKRDRFSHLREQPDNFSSLCPLNEESIELVCSMIDQHMELL